MAQRLNRQEYQRMQQYSHGNTLNISPPPSFSKVSTRISRKRLIYQVDHLKRSVHHHHALSSIAQEEKENTLNHQVSHGTQVITTRHLIQKDSEKLLRSPTDRLLSPVSHALQRRRNRKPLTEVKIRHFFDLK